jgi:alpha/beta superfamily hydrolase
VTTRSPIKEAASVDGPAGYIEALIESPRDHSGDRVAVICHPHPQYQGTMLNKVVHTLARTANDLGMPAVRFNFRGVGASDGLYDEGRGETEDAIAVCQWAQEKYSGAALWLAGFSFGAAVAVSAAAKLPVAQLITVAPPIARLGHLMAKQPTCPWLIVQGAADELVESGEVVDWVNELDPGPELIVLNDVDHFFHGRLTLLRQTLHDHLAAD